MLWESVRSCCSCSAAAMCCLCVRCEFTNLLTWAQKNMCCLHPAYVCSVSLYSRDNSAIWEGVFYHGSNGQQALQTKPTTPRHVTFLNKTRQCVDWGRPAIFIYWKKCLKYRLYKTSNGFTVFSFFCHLNLLNI